MHGVLDWNKHVSKFVSTEVSCDGYALLGWLHPLGPILGVHPSIIVVANRMSPANFRCTPSRANFSRDCLPNGTHFQLSTKVHADTPATFKHHVHSLFWNLGVCTLLRYLWSLMRIIVTPQFQKTPRRIAARWLPPTGDSQPSIQVAVFCCACTPPPSSCYSLVCI